jgi:hypothetical protein
MGITRSDYMLDAPDGALPTARIKQVEINTISVSFASLGTSTTALHRHACMRHAGLSPDHERCKLWMIIKIFTC